MFLVCRKKLEYPEQTHSYKLHPQRSQDMRWSCNLLVGIGQLYKLSSTYVHKWYSFIKLKTLAYQVFNNTYTRFKFKCSMIVEESVSLLVSFKCGVPQGSVLVSFVFFICMLYFGSIFKKGFRLHGEDTPIYLQLKRNGSFLIKPLFVSLWSTTGWLQTSLIC